MAGKVIQRLVNTGDKVDAKDLLLVIEQQPICVPSMFDSSKVKVLFTT